MNIYDAISKQFVIIDSVLLQVNDIPLINPHATHAIQLLPLDRFDLHHFLSL